MAIYLKEFQTTAGYNQAKDDFLCPHVSKIVETSVVMYDRQISISNATITCDNKTYNGETQIATNIVVVVNGNTLVENTDYTVLNNTGGINAGNYTFTVKGKGNYSDSKNGTFTIAKANGNVSTAPTPTNPDYNGSPQGLVYYGYGTGTMLYKLDSSWDTNIPSATTAGNYTIYYKASASTNYNESASGSVVCTITYPYIDGHEYVDLGLPSGTKWAKCYIGANNETDYGNYYQYGKGSAQYTETSGDSRYNGIESPLAASADTVVQVWGGSWHMPTREQAKELWSNTNHDWTTINGSSFRDSKKYVFFPAAGHIDGTKTVGVGTSASFWTSTPSDEYASYYYGMWQASGGYATSVDGNRGRVYGLNMRGVVG